MLIITRSATVIVVVAVPATMGENDAATQGQECKQGNQLCDSTKHFKILMVTPLWSQNSSSAVT
ncbi:hypothetical protein VC33_26915 [Pseudomonas fluorescens]|nr:hypothetical protein VC33_26915 [Pseudomonas fluorescens]OOG15330.1 hypothetical protein BMS17_25595 [Pseudomonas sp. C9]